MSATMGGDGSPDVQKKRDAIIARAKKLAPAMLKKGKSRFDLHDELQLADEASEPRQGVEWLMQVARSQWEVAEAAAAAREQARAPKDSATVVDAPAARAQKLRDYARALAKLPSSERAVRLKAVAKECDVSQAEVKRQITLARQEVATVEPSADTSQDNLALCFTATHGEDLRYVAPWGKWLMWNGMVWKPDERLAVYDMARELCRKAARDTSNADVAKHMRSASNVHAVVTLARSDPATAVSPNSLDSDPWVLNTPGGVVDLRTGTLMPSDRYGLHTKMTAVAPGGECPLFLAALERSLPDPEVRAYTQRLFGYALTGEIREHVLPFWYGEGRNGKGTLLRAIQQAMGDYAVEIATETLMESRGERHPTEMTQFFGVRLAIGSEVEEGAAWNETRIKRLTGGDPIKARYMQKDFFQYLPTHKLIVMGNNRPTLRKVDEAIRGRLHLVGFDVVIPAHERDPELPEKLKAELPGILAWAIQGCLEWQRIGLAPPKVIQEATGKYLEQENPVVQWVNESCERPGVVTLKAAMASYREWCDQCGLVPLGRNSFSDALARVPGVTKCDGKSVTFHGIGLPQKRSFVC